MPRTEFIRTPAGDGAVDINRGAHDFIAVVARNLETPVDVQSDYSATLAANAIGGVLFAIAQMGGLSRQDAEFASHAAITAVASTPAFGACVDAIGRA